MKRKKIKIIFICEKESNIAMICVKVLCLSFCIEILWSPILLVGLNLFKFALF